MFKTVLEWKEKKKWTRKKKGGKLGEKTLTLSYFTYPTLDFSIL